MLVEWIFPNKSLKRNKEVGGKCFVWRENIIPIGIIPSAMIFYGVLSERFSNLTFVTFFTAYHALTHP